MLFFVGNDGTVNKGFPSQVYQNGDESNTIYLVAPFAENLTVDVAFLLPNGVAVAPVAMTAQGAIPGLSAADGNGVSGWAYSLPNSITALYGTVVAQFLFYAADGSVIASSAVNFSVGRGVPPILPSSPSSTDWSGLRSVIASLQSDLKNGYYASRAVYAWNSAFTYGANEITFYPNIGKYGAFVKSLVANNKNAPYVNGAINSAYWQEVVNFNTIASDFFEDIQEAVTAAEAAQSAAETAEQGAEAAKTGAQTAQTAAETAAGQAQTSAGQAAGSASAAATSAGQAAKSATDALAAETEAEGYARQAGESAADAAESAQQAQEAVTNYYTKAQVDARAAGSISAEMNVSNYVLTLTLKSIDGQKTLSSETVDFPLESMVVSGSYDEASKSIILTLQNGTTTSIPIGDLIDGLASQSALDNVINGTTTVGNASNAETAEKLGTETVGANARPIYLNEGTPTASDATVGTSTRPVYMLNGVLTALSGNVGNLNLPVYINNGVLTVCSGTLNVDITGNAATAGKVENALTITIDGTPVEYDGSAPQSVSINTSSSTDPNAVHFTEQQLTSVQQEQARENIGAVGENDTIANAATADKVANAITIVQNGETVTYDGSQAKTVTIEAGGSNPNLLDNSDFFINQNGSSGLYALGQSIDRWRKTTSDGYISWSQSSSAFPYRTTVSFNKKSQTSFGNGTMLRQYLEKSLKFGGTYTVTLGYVGNAVDRPVTEIHQTFTLPAAPGGGTVSANFMDEYRISIAKVGTSSGTFHDYIEFGRFAATDDSPAALKFCYIKLEEGAVATPYVSPDPAKELLECQRYYVVFGEETLSFAARALSESTVEATIPLPVAMRAKPILTWTPSNWKVLFCNTSWTITSSYTAGGADLPALRLVLRKDAGGSVSSGAPCIVAITAINLGVNFALSAELTS